MNDNSPYTVTYYEPITENYVTEGYLTPELRNARINLLLIMGYTITGTNDHREQRVTP